MATSHSVTDDLSEVSNDSEFDCLILARVMIK